MRIQYATQRLLDSVWVIKYTVHNGTTATVLGYVRDTELACALEQYAPKLTDVIESNSDRILIAFNVDNGRQVKRYEVVNKRNIFSYKWD